MAEHYDEHHHPGRRSEDRHPVRTRVGKQINVTLEAGAIADGGTLIICMDNQDAEHKIQDLSSNDWTKPDGE